MSVAAPELLGSQEPTIKSVPSYVSTSGPEAIELAATAGLVLDPWQKSLMCDALGERSDGQWAAFEVAQVLARQNGKSGFFEARALAGLFLLGEELIMYSAHEFKTAAEIFKRLEELIAGTSSMRRRVKRVTRSKGDEGIELVTGQRLRFFARSNGSGRGFSGDCNIWDEAQHLGDSPVDAMLPTMSARPNPQLLYGGSAPDKDVAPCEPIARIRRRALAGGDPSLVYYEWSAILCNERCPEDCEEHDDPDDPQVWAKTNPGLGIRLTLERIQNERRSMSARGYARERLSVGNWPTGEDGKWAVISEAAWTPLADLEALPVDPVALAVHVASDRRTAAVAAAWRRNDGKLHVEVVRHNPGTGWVVRDVLAMVGRNAPCRLVLDPGSQTGSLIAELEAGLVNLGVELEITKTTARDVTQAVGQLYDAVMPTAGEPTLRYTAYAGLTSAVAGADKRTLGDAWAWDRRAASVDLCPLEAATFAAWGYVTRPVEEKMPPPATARAAPSQGSDPDLYRPTSRLNI